MIYLRKLNYDDLPFLRSVENDHSNWNTSNTIQNYNDDELKCLIDYSMLPISLSKQIRFVICLDLNQQRLGFIDLFDIDFTKSSAGVSLIIANKNERSKGYGSLALNKLIKYSVKELNINKLYCNILNDNLASIKCFESAGFKRISFDGTYTKSLSEKFNKNKVAQFICT